MAIIQFQTVIIIIGHEKLEPVKIHDAPAGVHYFHPTPVAILDRSAYFIYADSGQLGRCGIVGSFLAAGCEQNSQRDK